MRLRDFLVAVPLACWALVPVEKADACGGCFVQQTENTQVTGHRMILSVSQDQTTLYDQIQYAGNPEEFAWVLPIRGQVDIGLSSDALFATLEAQTTVDIVSPQISCPPPEFCDDFAGAPNSEGSGGQGGGEEGVEIIAQEVVGPYETVQLAAEDPQALIDWLEGHGYNIPEDIQPIIDAYVADGFGFLALRLVPGESVESMRPVAVTTPGAGAALPLKMVAAGTGAITPISLWVIGEGRYEPENFPSFVIDGSDLVWDWDQARSNYSDLRAQGFEDSDGFAWLTEAAEPLSPYAFEELLYLAEYDSVGSGYADDDGQNAQLNAEADIARLLTGIDLASAWVTRMSAELPRDALGEDLALQASLDQTTVERYFYVQNTVGTEPSCPVNPPVVCGDDDDGGDDGFGADPDDPFHVDRDSSCSASPRMTGWSTFALGSLALAGWVAVRRRRRRA